MADTTDLTFRTDRNNNMVIGKRGEYVCNVVNMLFNMVPGTDEYNPKRGLDIRRKARQPNESGSRDTSYESEIISQFTTYTDLIPMNVVVRYKNHKMYIYMQVRYMDVIYELDINNELDDIKTVLRKNF
ncbi:hypothetical protein [uncultured Duncaniella sp.]|uniref:hypothetical protein n=1 Tax=uncultured Duncaniella sp. TaxID=2768039 RepID=UPI0026252041|nr:hypothetical protein [uncultured Duncaniella sp.]